MVKINQGITNFQEPEEGEQYKILSAEDTTQKDKSGKDFKGLAMEFVPVKETEQTKKMQFRITAWYGQSDFVGSKSKLGAFISAFTDFYESNLTPDEALTKARDTDTWLGHTIKVLEWRNKNREIKVIA